MIKEDYISLRLNFEYDLDSFLFNYIQFFIPNFSFVYFSKFINKTFNHNISKQSLVDYLDNKNKVTIIKLDTKIISIY